MYPRGRGGSAALRSTDAVLQRASSALRGDRPGSRGSGDDEEAGIGAYISALSRQTNTKQYKWDEMLDMSDKSDDEIMVKPSDTASKFLKKKPQKEETAVSVDLPKSSTTGPSKSRSFNKYSAQNKSKNTSALSKAAAYSDSFKNKRREVVKFSDSDLDMDLSVDSEIASELNIPKTTSQLKSSTKVQTNKPVPKPRRPPLSPQSSSDSEFGKTGNRFMKKNAPARPESPEEEIPKAPSPTNAKKPSMFHLKSAERFSQEKPLDSDEESLQEFIQGLSASSSGEFSARTPRSPAAPPKGSTTPRRRVKPMSPPPHRSPTPLEDISERDELGEDENTDSSDGPVVKLMDLDALEAVALPEPKKKKKKTHTEQRGSAAKAGSKEKQVERKKSVEFFEDLGLHTVDELLGPGGDVISEAESESASVMSEVRSDVEKYELDLPPSPSPAPLKSILSTPRTPRSSRRVRLSLTDVRSRSPSPEAISTARATTSVVYTEDFDEPTHSEPATSIKTDAYESDESIHTAISSGRSSPVRGRQRQRSESEYSDDFTSAGESVSSPRRGSRQYSRSSSRESDDSYSYSDSYTSYTESRTELVRYGGAPRQPVETRNAEIQTGLDLGSLLYQWDPAAGTAVSGREYGLGSVDPTPIASHVVSPDTLEALTGYSPSVLALNDMLRMQLQLTSQFLQTQRRLHESYVRLAAPDYKYTTLEDTKAYMKKHRRPTITFEEALKQVNEELGLDT